MIKNKGRYTSLCSMISFKTGDLVLVMYTCNPSTGGSRGRRIRGLNPV